MSSPGNCSGEPRSDAVGSAGDAMLNASVKPRSALVNGDGGDPPLNAFENAPLTRGEISGDDVTKIRIAAPWVGGLRYQVRDLGK